MKKQINPNLKAHLIRGAFYLLVLLAVCVIPFALAQRTIGRQSSVGSTMQFPITPSDSDRDASALPTSEFPMGCCLWNQYNNPATEPPLGIGSQKFEPPMAVFDDQAADDFVVNVPPPPMFLYVTGVRVMGEYSAGGGPASSFNVYFYTNRAGHLPGTQIAAFLNRPYSGTPPDFEIRWTPISIFPSSGTYWVSVQAVQDFNPNGQWFWHNRTVQTNAGAVWQNPGDGYGTGCTTWNRKNACMPDQVWPDQVFQILGFPEGPTPTATVTPLSSPSPTPTATPTPTPILCVLSQNFDGVTPPALPPGWTAANAINPDGVLWQTSNSGLPSPPADTLPNAAWTNDPATVSDKRLTSPPVTIPFLQNAGLMFRHNYAFEDGFDGGVLEISIDGGAFQDAAAFIGQGGYNGTISTCCGNPLAGRQAWTGNSGGFITTQLGLPSGHTIALRWRMGSDNGGSGQGWRIDPLQGFCEGPTPTSTPTVTASPTPTATFTPTATATATNTPTPTVTATPTASPTVTATPTPTLTVTATPTATATPRPSPTPRPAATPRPRPTPPPRP
jgi:hypothetical protein